MIGEEGAGERLKAGEGSCDGPGEDKGDGEKSWRLISEGECKVSKEERGARGRRLLIGEDGSEASGEERGDRENSLDSSNSTLS